MLLYENEIVVDVEGDDLFASKIWCCSYKPQDGSDVKTLISYDDMKSLLSRKDVTIIGHNFWGWDIPTVERILGIKVRATIVDTLAVSWYLYPKRMKHGLEQWGEDLGVAKPEIEDWSSQALEDYTHRCEQDVEINTLLWSKMKEDLIDLYGSVEGAVRAVDYVSFKAYCAYLQEQSKWRLDVEGAEGLVKFFNNKIEESKLALEAVMPEVPKYSKKTMPAKPYKKDGSLSAHGLKWKELCEEHGKPFKYGGEIKVVSKYEPPNAGSVQQIKDWITTMGWTPTIFNHVRNKDTGEVRKVPQLKDKDTGELCGNIQKLTDEYPELNLLIELGILQHRKSVVEGFLNDVDEDGFVVARVQGFTNTLRFRHKVCLNLPSLRKPYGKEIRGLLLASDEDHELMGSDMASLEDRTKQHYMWPHDPDYVLEMQKPGFDPHCDIALEAGIMSSEEVLAYKYMDIKGLNEMTGRNGNSYVKKELSNKRHAGKGTNYSSTYGAGAATIARTAGVPPKVGKKLHKAYWNRNWSLKAIASKCKVKKCMGLNWLWNPVAKVWYWLKKDKDRFSTLNQGTGTYCFDMWIKEILKSRKQLTGQFHDEGIWNVKKGHRKQAEELLRKAVSRINNELKLDRDLDIDVQFGNSYAEIH